MWLAVSERWKRQLNPQAFAIDLMGWKSEGRFDKEDIKCKSWSGAPLDSHGNLPQPELFSLF